MAFCLVPDLTFPALTDVTAEALRSRGITFLMMDFDNTIVPYTTDVPSPAFRSWVQEMRSSGIFLCVVSNSRKPRVVRFCQENGLACVTHSRKPFQKGIREALARYRLDPRRTALAGDQIYTDVLGANCGGLTSILITPICLHNVWLRLRHGLEQPFIFLARKRKK